MMNNACDNHGLTLISLISVKPDAKVLWRKALEKALKANKYVVMILFLRMRVQPCKPGLPATVAKLSQNRVPRENLTLRTITHICKVANMVKVVPAGYRPPRWFTC
jgi:hypothetical protein